jgi:hypothetical protein
MNKLETKDKLIKFCQGLHKEGLLSNEELKECHSAFNKRSVGLSRIGNLPKINDNLENYGMSKDQSLQSDKLLLGMNKEIICRIVSHQTQRTKDDESKKVKLTLFSSMETDITANNLYIKNIENTGDSNNDYFNDKLVSNITFKLTKTDNGLYTIKNLYSNELVRVEMDKRVKINATNQTNNSLFNIKLIGKYVKFESNVFPGYFLSASNPLKVIEGSSPLQNWNLEIIENDNENLDISNNNEYTASYTRQLVEEYLKNYEISRIDYLMNSAQIKYIEILQNRIKNIVSRNGIMIKYIEDRINNGEIKIPNEQLMKIKSNMYEEVINNEIELLEVEKNLLKEKLNNNKLKNDFNKNNIVNIVKLLNDAIQEKKLELATLNQFIDKVNNETKKLNHKDNEISNIITLKEEIFDKSTHNNTIIEKQYQQNILNFRIILGLYIILSGFAIFLSYKLYKKIKKEL